ncbi:MAG: sigma-70 family RNA polymerase sigma factor [Patescibacteria group bacterium]
MPTENENQLVSQYLAGDQEALKILINRYLKLIYNFIYYHLKNQAEAEDITQEVFIKVWRNLQKFDQTKNFKTWLYKIAYNTCIDFLRRQKAIPFSEFEDEAGRNPIVDNLADPAPLPPELFERQDLAAQLTAAIDQLPLKDRTVVLLHYQNQLTFREIADALDQPLNTVKSRYQRALFVLKKHLLA